VPFALVPQLRPATGGQTCPIPPPPGDGKLQVAAG